jgi:MoaA/NifB/PqqE/SkfB family radical SAM enzyme
MAESGMRSVILIGGGEPTIYPGFTEVVRFLKELGQQVAIVSNGSRNDRILEIMDVLTEGDWVRLSLDSGSNETFERMHRPVKAITLDEICEWVPRLRQRNPKPLVGFSYIIVWSGAEREEGAKIVPNIDEIVMAAKRARDFGFSYISLKPFLTRRPDGAEVMDPSATADLERTIRRIRAAVDEAKAYETPDFKVIESINLRVLEQGSWQDYTHQPSMCHMQVLRQVLSPLGLYNCPAHRGVEKAKIGDKHGWAGPIAIGQTTASTAGILDRFDASHECREVTCLYNRVNWWLEEAIEGKHDLTLASAGSERFDYFL